ncbi:NAD(P)-binding domain-containing protein [Gracilibacillus caseinilyticus]|uniref:NAD(P)-binding domain-containing protein n=1 Tax=Gracilibacillus caseinilyticus TaxID=2932256 RepID=A0ABY4EY31_9BACI|nr:NAD(P)/FAD-dependent oxidoreductase [Gracilibacillus caseinilyticus]UOQ48792.1 NAD(P)-binding domain-containing protein [Gracilibacillus caseinilyticus]
MNKIYDIIVVGAGPSGIGVAALLQQMNCTSYLIIEKEEVGASFQRWPEEMRFITPSFPAQGFGHTDLNAIVPKTSPAYTLDMEHPSGEAYAEYLNVIADHFTLPIKEGVQVNQMHKKAGIFSLDTTEGTYQSRFVIWAAGQYQYPNLKPFPGAEVGVHNSLIPSWEGVEGDDFVIIGGYESGMDAAFHLGRTGKRATLIAKTNTWEIDNSDPSIALSTYTYGRVRPLLDSDLLRVVGNTAVTRIEKVSSGYDVYTSSGKVYFTKEKPILATGFSGSTSKIENLVRRGKYGEVLVDERDESVATPGLFLAGPELRHDDHIFCYIYKFRQRFAVIAETIGHRLDLDLSILAEYKRENFYLNDLSMCGERCQC